MDPQALREQWESLVSVATLGTSRIAVPSGLRWPGGLEGAISGAPERTLLRLAAATALWQEMGRRSPAEAAPARPPKPEGTPPRMVSEAAARRLVRMTAGEYPAFVPEWFALAGSAGLVLPPHWLPPVLDGLEAGDRDGYAVVLGEHAAWLAALNPAWRHRPASTPPSEERWLTGDGAEREAELTALRRIDPAAARRWVEGSWQTDSAEDRERFVRALLIGLSLDDEPFLEAALDDRKKEVRGAAVECLLMLPGSAHAQRMRGRADVLLSFDPGKERVLRRSVPRLGVTLPAPPDKPSVRDGISLKPSGSRKATGEREFWLKQIVSAVAPGHWTTRFSCEPGHLVEAVMGHDHGAALLEALTAAAVRHRDGDWVEPLVSAWSSGDDEASAGPASVAVARLFEVLSLDQRRRALEAWLARLPPGRTTMALTVLTELPASWDEPVTQRAFERLASACRRDTQAWSHPRTTLAAWAHHADPAVALPLAAAVLEQCRADSPWQGAIRHLTEVLEFRAEMHKELHS